MAILPFKPFPTKPMPDQKAELDFLDSDFSKLMEVWGNGNPKLGFILFQRVTLRLEYARTKHPVFAEGKYQALGVIGAEYQELEYAVEHESPQRQEDEALDVITSPLRFAIGEHEIAEGA